MKGQTDLVFIPDCHRVVVYGSQHIHLGRGLGNIRRTDKDHRELTVTFHRISPGKTAKLPSVRISTHGNRQCTQMFLAASLNGLGQQDQSGAGGKDRQAGEDFFLNRCKKIQFVEKLSLDGTFPAGQNDAGKVFQIFFLADLNTFRTQTFQYFFMLDKGALKGQYSYFCHMDQIPRSSMISLISDSLIPTIASPRSLERSAMRDASV